jgi:hypothetical protein
MKIMVMFRMMISNLIITKILMLISKWLVAIVMLTIVGWVVGKGRVVDWLRRDRSIGGTINTVFFVYHYFCYLYCFFLIFCHNNIFYYCANYCYSYSYYWYHLHHHYHYIFPYHYHNHNHHDIYFNYFFT